MDLDVNSGFFYLISPLQISSRFSLSPAAFLLLIYRLYPLSVSFFLSPLPLSMPSPLLPYLSLPKLLISLTSFIPLYLDFSLIQCVSILHSHYSFTPYLPIALQFFSLSYCFSPYRSISHQYCSRHLAFSPFLFTSHQNLSLSLSSFLCGAFKHSMIPWAAL